MQLHALVAHHRFETLEGSLGGQVRNQRTLRCATRLAVAQEGDHATAAAAASDLGRKPAVLRRELHHAVALWVAHANGVEQVVVDAYQLLQEAVTSPDCPANKLLGVGLLVLAPRAVTQSRG